jgi:chromosome segregation ATPase
VWRTDLSPEQRARDSDSRAILEAELKKAEAKLAEQQKEFNNGEPEKQGIEGRNYQRYLDRVAELKDSIARNQSDIAGLKREISRLPSALPP